MTYMRMFKAALLINTKHSKQPKIPYIRTQQDPIEYINKIGCTHTIGYIYSNNEKTTDIHNKGTSHKHTSEPKKKYNFLYKTLEKEQLKYTVQGYIHRERAIQKSE